MMWYDQQSECCPTQLLLLKRIRNLAANKRRCTKCPFSYTALIAFGFRLSQQLRIRMVSGPNPIDSDKRQSTVSGFLQKNQ
ncbi:hypothetical protein TNCV_2798061 [Trichonephila clavipes]|nr:hypothetical protein TNCV_2798061 [Trichonephila clavipes]